MSEVVEKGAVEWFSSGKDEWPDVGLSVSLGGGSSVYVGEFADATLAEHGLEPAGAGWWLALELPSGYRIVGPVEDIEAARELIDHLVMALLK